MLEKRVLSVLNHRGREAVRYTPPWRAMLRSASRLWTQEESGIPRPDRNSTYFHSSSDAVYFENIPIFTAFKVPPLRARPRLSRLRHKIWLIFDAMSDIFKVVNSTYSVSIPSNVQPKNTVCFLFLAGRESIWNTYWRRWETPGCTRCLNDKLITPELECAKKTRTAVVSKTEGHTWQKKKTS